MRPQDPPLPSNEPSQPGFARRAAEALKKAVWRSDSAEAAPNQGVATVATLAERVKKYLPSSDIQKVKDAFRFSDEAHLGQFRRSGAPVPVELHRHRPRLSPLRRFAAPQNGKTQNFPRRFRSDAQRCR